MVPFIGRVAELAELARLRDDPWLGPSVMLVHGSGGQGKTRLIEEFARQTVQAADGWSVRTATRGIGTRPHPAAVEAGPPCADPVLLMVDYAERWPTGELLNLIADHTSAGRVRIVLVARPAGPWWDALRARLTGDLAVADIDTLLVEPLARDLAERVAMFVAARDRFGELLGVAGVDRIPVPSALADDGFGLTLAVHMAALAAVDALARGTSAPDDQIGLAIYLLNREREHWRALHALPRVSGSEPDVAHLGTPPIVMARTVYLATLTRAVGHEAGREVVVRGGPAVDADVSVDEILADHARCYPPADPSATVLEPLYPDRLGEDFVALFTPGHRNVYPTDPWVTDAMLVRLLAADDSGASREWAGPSVALLIEAAHRWPHLSGRLNLLLAQQPGLALTAGVAAMVRLADLSGIDPHVLADIENFAPARHVDLDVGLAALARRLLEFTDDPARHARLQCRLAMRLVNAGQHNLAVGPVESAVAALRPLAGNDPRHVST